jgi:hypothetical protein
VLYVTYTDFELNYEVFWIGEIPATLPREMRTTIRMVVSEDGGLTWTEPVAVSPTVRRGYGERDTGDPAPACSAPARGAGLAAGGGTGRHGVRGLARQHRRRQHEGRGEIYARARTTRDATFSTPVIASVFNEIDFRPRNAFFRYWGASFPQLASARTASSTSCTRPADRRTTTATSSWWRRATAARAGRGRGA